MLPATNEFFAALAGRGTSAVLGIPAFLLLAGAILLSLTLAAKVIRRRMFHRKTSFEEPLIA